MPRNVRNFWIELDVDGSKTAVETGPRSKDGGFSLTVRMRDGGGIMRALDVRGRADQYGELTLTVGAESVQPGRDIISISTKR